jgi:outer membrane receptor protein involved in Fe transport
MEIFYNNNLNNTTNLRPETTFQTDLGVNFSQSSIGILDYFNISADLYYNDIKDKIMAIPAYNLFSWTMQNIGKVKILGCDVNLHVAIQPAKDLVIYTNSTYTFQNATDYTNPNFPSYKQQLPYTPKHSASAVVGLSYYFDISYSLLFSGKRYSNGSPSILSEVPAFFEHNIAISKNISVKKTNIRIFVKLNNIANSNYEIVKNYPMPGFNFLLGLSVSL